MSQGHFARRTWGLTGSCHLKAKVSRTSVIAMSVLACLQIFENIFENIVSMLQIFENIVSMWDNVLKNGPSKMWERKPLKSLKGYGLLKADTITLQIF